MHRFNNVRMAPCKTRNWLEVENVGEERPGQTSSRRYAGFSWVIFSCSSCPLNDSSSTSPPSPIVSPPITWTINSDQLEWSIENRYSYRDLKGVDYQAALDAIRAGLGEGIATEDFAHQLDKLIAPFGDGHSKIKSHAVSLGSLCTRFSPFPVDKSDGRLVAFRAERTDFIDSKYPFLRVIDGMPVEQRLQTASQ
ncbi:hypothetical protein AMJ85_10435 [candidate division BRC1 bacterium SM23_51]|nr:MAG: hypothetical protein AMJ85_10435 [candidate division BRC1 bacterium SM23_51]